MSRNVGFGLLLGGWVVLAMAWMVYVLWSAGSRGFNFQSPDAGIRLRLRFAAVAIPLGFMFWWLAQALHLVD